MENEEEGNPGGEEMRSCFPLGHVKLVQALKQLDKCYDEEPDTDEEKDSAENTGPGPEGSSSQSGESADHQQLPQGIAAHHPQESMAEQVSERMEVDGQVPETMAVDKQVPETIADDTQSLERMAAHKQVPETVEGDKQSPERVEGDKQVPKRMTVDEQVPETVEGDKQTPERNGDEKLTAGQKLRIKFLKALLDSEEGKTKDEMKLQLFDALGLKSDLNDLSKEILYELCEQCLEGLKENFLVASESEHVNPETSDLIKRNSCNLSWLVWILLDREQAQEFFEKWASQSEVSNAYFRVAPELRIEISWITGILLIGIGNRQVYATKKTRYLLLKAWLVPLCKDYLMITRHRNWIELGLGATIFSLAQPMQHELFFEWLKMRMNSGKDIPRLVKWPELWWTDSFDQEN